MATPYASMLLEAREGEAAVVPLEPFRRPQPDRCRTSSVTYSANRNRYMVPEQRTVIRIARYRARAVASVARLRPGDRGLLQRQPGDLRRQGNPRT